MAEFPFGINPGLPLPGQVPSVSVEVENMGDMTFDDPTESVAGLVAQVVSMNSVRTFRGGTDFFTVTAWDPGKGRLKVKLNSKTQEYIQPR